MLEGDIVVITKGSISDYLYQYGIIVKEEKNYLKIIDMFPPLPKEERFSKIFKVNDCSPLKKESWNKAINEVDTDKEKYKLELLVESKVNYIVHTKKISYFSFKNFSDCLPNVTHFRDLLIIDFRYNYGGEVRLIHQYQDFFKRFLTASEKNRVICVVGASTASSAELLLEKISRSSQVFVIGTETYKKEFAYKVIEKKDKLVMIPSKKLNLNVVIDKSFVVSDYYDFYFECGKRYFTIPQIISFGFLT